MSQAARSAALL